ncbi:unnamed protein product [Diplocarpon coronariae]|uniref:Uncharacterized protein n=1 Tax=Diplocarpon coronariae TaxID=2795749 RepID=A0A218Z0Q7_9HELO|nr:hypothetical protein JHW43_008664 [Diplocarpon mali]OWP01651.1 hypothetical protein B2J93_2928 [Marssonina coronariae]
MTVVTLPPTPQTTAIAFSLLSPALAHSLTLFSVCHRLLSTTTLFLFLRTYMLSLLLLRNSLYASQFLALQLARNSLAAVRAACRMGWKATENLRKKLFFEFMVFVLGGGNALMLVLFWPGWIVLGGALGLWKVCG